MDSRTPAILALFVGTALIAADAHASGDGPVAGKVWRNSLGMELVPVPNVDVLFCKWPTRRQDFELFVKETGHDAVGGMIALAKDWWQDRGETWMNPGYRQGPTHPVVGLSLLDATAFCDWLTRKEQAAGLLRAGQCYRLPYDHEWSRAAGMDQGTDSPPPLYPWGDEWPPPEGVVNCAGVEVVRDGNWPEAWNTNAVAGHDDGYARTSPVGTFKPNRYGLYDMSGNVWEWCAPDPGQDLGGSVLRGGCWDDFQSWALQTSYRLRLNSAARSDSLGFRCVLDPGRDDSATGE